MPHIATMTDALRAIWERSGYDRGYISNPFAGDDAARLGLVRTHAVLIAAGYSDLPYEIVHIAGSKGKGSVCISVDGILRAAGHRTGRYMSPQLHSFRERFVVDDAIISEDDFVALTRHFIAAAREVERNEPELGEITAFELSTAMAFGWFAEQRCEVAVIEVGLGGTLDATNIITPTVAVITTLDYEHTAILGETMTEIADNKAGIIKPHRPVLTAQQPDEAMDVIRTVAAANHSPMAIAGEDWQVLGIGTDFAFTDGQMSLTHLETGLVGDHQMHNTGLAIAAVRTLQQHATAITIDESAIRLGLTAAQLPGRFEHVTLADGRTIIIDGAHTPKSAAALAAAMQDRFGDTSLTTMIGMLADKNARAVLAPLQALHPRWIVTAPSSPRALPTDQLAAEIVALGERAETAESVAAAIERAKADEADTILITGSFTTVAEARVALGLAEAVDPPIR